MIFHILCSFSSNSCDLKSNNPWRFFFLFIFFFNRTFACGLFFFCSNAESNFKWIVISERSAKQMREVNIMWNNHNWQLTSTIDHKINECALHSWIKITADCALSFVDLIGKQWVRELNEREINRENCAFTTMPLHIGPNLRIRIWIVVAFFSYSMVFGNQISHTNQAHFIWYGGLCGETPCLDIV